MSRKFCFTVPYSVPVEQLHRAITDDELWRARFGGSDSASVDLSHPDGPGTIRIHMTERPRPDRIPSIVGRVLKTGLVLERVDTWGPLTGVTVRGSFTGSTTGIGAEMSGSYELRPAGAGAELEVAGTVTVFVPLVGGVIEPLAEQVLHRVVTSERTFIENRLRPAA